MTLSPYNALLSRTTKSLFAMFDSLLLGIRDLLIVVCQDNATTELCYKSREDHGNSVWR